MEYLKSTFNKVLRNKKDKYEWSFSSESWKKYQIKYTHSEEYLNYSKEYLNFAL